MLGDNESGLKVAETVLGNSSYGNVYVAGSCCRLPLLVKCTVGAIIEQEV